MSMMPLNYIRPPPLSRCMSLVIYWNVSDTDIPKGVPQKYILNNGDNNA